MYLTSLCVLSTLVFHQSDPLYILFLLFLRCIVLLLLETAPQVFANFSLDGLFLGDLLCPLLSGCSIWITWYCWRFRRPRGLAFQPWHTMDSDLSLKGQLRFREDGFFSFLKTMLLKIIFKWTLKCFANPSSLNPPNASKEFRVQFTCFYIFLHFIPYLLSQTLGEQPSCLCLISPQIILMPTQVWELPL